MTFEFIYFQFCLNIIYLKWPTKCIRFIIIIEMTFEFIYFQFCLNIIYLKWSTEYLKKNVRTLEIPPEILSKNFRFGK